MWVEHAAVASSAVVDGGGDDDQEGVLAWVTADGREVRWMNEQEMKQVGVTSGVKKVLKAVKEHQQQQQCGKKGKVKDGSTLKPNKNQETAASTKRRKR